jgi:hypothetical protein
MADDELLALALTPELLERCRRALAKSKRLASEFLAADQQLLRTLATLRKSDHPPSAHSTEHIAPAGN